MRPKQSIVGTRLPPKLSASFHSICRSEEKVPAELLREMVRDGVARHKTKIGARKRASKLDKQPVEFNAS